MKEIKFELNGKKFKSIVQTNESNDLVSGRCNGCCFYKNPDADNVECGEAPHNCLMEDIIYVEDK